MRKFGFRVARALLYRVLIPLSMRSGPLEPFALHVFRRLLNDRAPNMSGLPCPIHIEGLTFWYDSDRPSNTIRGLATGTYERSIAEFFAASLHSGMAVLDVGAHIGYFSLLSAKFVGSTGRVWSFEPDPDNRASLERNIEENAMVDIITVVPLAVTSGCSERVLYRVAGDTGSSTLYPTQGVGGEQVAVKTISLDEWAQAEGWPRIDLVKMDTEGAEGDVLAGMTELVGRNPAIVLVLEFQADVLELADEDPVSFLTRLLSMAPGHVEILEGGDRRILREPDIPVLVRRSRWAPLNLALRHIHTRLPTK